MSAARNLFRVGQRIYFEMKGVKIKHFGLSMVTKKNSLSLGGHVTPLAPAREHVRRRARERGDLLGPSAAVVL